MLQHAVDKILFQPKNRDIFSYFFPKTYAVGTHQKHLCKALQMSNHNMFLGRNKKKKSGFASYLELCNKWAASSKEVKWKGQMK